MYWQPNTKARHSPAPSLSRSPAYIVHLQIITRHSSKTRSIARVSYSGKIRCPSSHRVGMWARGDLGVGTWAAWAVAVGTDSIFSSSSFLGAWPGDLWVLDES